MNYKYILTAILVMSVFSGTASAWLTGYDHRMAITVNNGGASSLSYYQFNFTNDTNVLVSAGNMQASGADCRITDASDNLLPFWNETPFNVAGTKIWVNATTLAVGDNTFYMYYGNAGASSVSNGTNVFEFFDDFGGLPTTRNIYSYYTTTSDQEIINRSTVTWGANTTHAFSPVHNATIQELNIGGHKYWGYLSDSEGNGIGLYFSEDLINWTAYSSNPILGANHRWPSVTYNSSSSTFKMLYCNWGAYDIILTTSSDGYTWTDQKTIESDGNNPYLWKDPTDNNWVVIYHKHSGGLAYRKAATIEGLDTATAITLNLNFSYDSLAAPSLIYDYSNGEYVLAFEYLSDSIWYVGAATSPTLDGPWLECSNSPILSYGACDAQFIVGSEIYNYYSKQEGSYWNDYLSIHTLGSIEKTGESETYEIDPNKWTITGENPGDSNWASISTTQKKNGKSSLKLSSESAGNCAVNHSFSPSINNVIIEYWFWDNTSDTTAAEYFGDLLQGADTLFNAVSTADTGQNIGYHDGSWHDSGVARVNGWAKIQFKVKGNVDFIFNEASTIYTNNANKVTDALDVFRIKAQGATDTFYIDTIRVRQYASPEPAATLGAEETGGGGCGAYNITLPLGWSIIGWTNPTASTAHSMGTLIGGNCQYVTERNSTTGLYVTHVMSNPTEDNFATERGWGYFVKTTAETLWERDS